MKWLDIIKIPEGEIREETCFIPEPGPSAPSCLPGQTFQWVNVAGTGKNKLCMGDPIHREIEAEKERQELAAMEIRHAARRQALQDELDRTREQDIKDEMKRILEEDNLRIKAWFYSRPIPDRKDRH